MSPFLLPLLLLAAKAPACGLAQPAGCQTTNELVSAPGFEPAVKRFLGARRAPYLYRNASVADQLLDALGGPPDAPRRIGGAWLFTACRAHSCMEKGAAVVEPGGRLAALTLIHFDCAVARPADDCSQKAILTMFVRDRTPANAYGSAIRSWAEAAVAADSIPSSPERLAKAETVVVTAPPR